MQLKSAKTVALVTIALLVVGGLFGSVAGQVQGTNKVTFSLSVQGNNGIPASGVNVEVESPNGVLLANNTSTPTVEFQAYPGNYVINVPSQYAMGTVYNNRSYDVKVASNGTVYNGNSEIRYIVLNFTTANANLLITVDGTSQINSVYVTLPNTLVIPASKLNASNSSSPFTLSTVAGIQYLSVQYYNGSIATYTEQITTSVGKQNVTADVSLSGNLIGSVSSTNGSFVKTDAVSLYQSGKFIAYDQFKNGYYYLSVPAGTYTIVVSSPGYLPYSFTATSSNGVQKNFPVSLTPSSIVQTETITYGTSFNSVTMEGGVTLTNSTVLFTMPYSTSGSLYNQMKLLGISKGNLWEILNSTVPATTVSSLLFNNYSYNSTSITTTLQSGSGGKAMWFFNFTASYSQPSISAGTNNTIQVFANENSVKTSSVSFAYDLKIPQSYQRANVISSNVATVSGYSGLISITNSSTSGFIMIKLSQKEKPTLNLNEIVSSWSGSFESTIMNSSANNFTLLVPTNKQVTLNASSVPYDNVLGTDNYQQMTFLWNFSNGLKATGYTITENLTGGDYTVSLTVTSSAGVSNSTNLTIISDANNPLFALNVIQNGKSVLNVSTSSSTSYALWVNQSSTVYFNALSSKDKLASGEDTGVPLSINWNISGNKETGFNVSYSFTSPTFGSTVLYTNVSIKNGVGNSFNVSLMVHVNDTTLPIVSFQIDNSSGKIITSTNQYKNVTLNGSKTYAPSGGNIVSYTWSFSYSNGTAAKPNVDYKVYSSSSNNSTIRLAFLQYGTFSINLKVRDQSNNTASTSKSLIIHAVGPEIEFMNVTYPKTYVEGSSSTLNLVMKNVGLSNASTYYVTVKIGSKVVKNETFSNLTTNGTVNETIIFVPPASGSYSMVIAVHAVNEPSFFNANVTITKAISVSQAAWKLPALIGGIVVAIGVLSFIYYDVTVRRKRSKDVKQQKKQLKI